MPNSFKTSGLAQVQVPEHRPCHSRFGKPGLEEASVLEVGTFEVGVGKVGAVEFGALKIGTGEMSAAKLGVAKVRVNQD